MYVKLFIMEEINLFKDFLAANQSSAREIPEQQIQTLMEELKQLNEKYALEANASLISAANVFLNQMTVYFLGKFQFLPNYFLGFFHFPPNYFSVW